MGRLFAGIVTVVAATALGGGRPASAQVEQVPLAWSAPAGCPTTAAVLAEVRRNLAESGETGTPFLAQVVVQEPAPGRWQADLRLQARGGRTEPTASRCRTGARATTAG